ncbi:hypothetical protein LEP1GSC170_0016 [Leptospira interrogans serovar Bataviae str. HAI135]|nr:hypothetical protein LEP1GSC170_0016 [Leptospira interrogans serovar Bataviae str. HAI135]
MLSLKKAKEALSQITRLLPSDVIIKRGIELYNSGDVHDLIETKRNHYHTKVLGNSALYELEIQISSPQKRRCYVIVHMIWMSIVNTQSQPF